MSSRRTRWQWFGRSLLLAFFIVVAVMLVRYARFVNWREVGNAIASYDRALLTGVIGLAALSYALYSSYDLLARVYTGHAISKRRVMAIAGVSYAFNLNLGALVGGAGFRYRLYSRFGLDPATITRILGFSITTNWLGYVALAGALFATRGVSVPEKWSLGVLVLQVPGFVLLIVVLAYFVACAVTRDRVWSVRGQEIRLPSVRLALTQSIVSAANWLTIATIVYLLLRRQVAFPTVLGVMLFGAIAGAMTHIPAGLGVIEVVVLTLLGEQLPEDELLAALLAYRAIYYIGPLLLAFVMYARFESIAGARWGTKD